ncbi:MAG TPA: FeoA family protein [Kiritimatiellia bacterium]|nr:FeoA family protein [Kiritimatiellia bacterium]
MSSPDILSFDGPGLALLDSLPAGHTATVLHLDSTHEAAPLLRRIGCCEGACVEILTSHDPCLLRCDGTCIALHRHLLKAVCVHCPLHQQAIAPPPAT